MNKILIIDGNNILNRSFYATKKIINNTNKNSAVYGFLRTYYKFKKIIFPNKVIVCFDKSSQTFRKRLYSLYKNNRVKMPNELFHQLVLIKKILKFMNVQILELDNFEADDIIGSLCSILKKDNQCFILSGDKDLFQLIDDNVNIYYVNTVKNISRTMIYNKNIFFKKYQFNNKYFVDYKALVGDTSDNIPGVNGIGNIYATKIITHYNTIDNLYYNINDFNINMKLKEKLILNKENAYLSYYLSKIKTNINLIIHNNIEQPDDKSKIYQLFDKLGFKNLLLKL